MDIEEIKELVRQNYTDPDFNVNMLIDKTGMHYSVLHEEFVRNLSITPSLYIENLRLKRALILLHQNGKTVCEIGKLAGFPSTRTFRNVLKKRLAKSPVSIRDELAQISNSDLGVVIDRLLMDC
jgi:two-component system response regulator YesN